jgi:hypothetical protein
VLWQFNLIHLFDFYLTLIFILSTALRVRQYRELIGLVRKVPGRWPRLYELIKRHRSILLTKATLGPALLALGLWVTQILASQLVWPDAGRPEKGLSLGRLWEHPAAVPLVLTLGVAMVAFDLYGAIKVGAFDHKQMEAYFDQAEYWLKSWTAPVVRVFTLGFINPRRMVAIEVRSALESATRLLNSTLWWVCIQTGLRIGYGLSLWGTYAWTRVR